MTDIQHSIDRVLASSMITEDMEDQPNKVLIIVLHDGVTASTIVDCPIGDAYKATVSDTLTDALKKA